MNYVNHSMIKENTIEERLYQSHILNTAVNKNTLVVLPTGTGKTNISVLLAAHRLEKYPDSKILIMSPTRPLCSQHQKSFENYFKIIGDITLVTGVIQPAQRKKAYDTSVIVIATPQTIENDVRNGILDLSDFSMLTVDEAHKAVGSYAYTYVAEMYMKQSKFPRILALTASPGSTKEKIDIIRKNLSIDAVEIRTETDADVKDYIKEKEVEYVKVELPEELKRYQELLKTIIKEKLSKLKAYDIYANNKRDLLEAQKRFSKKLATEKNPAFYHVIASTAEAIKIWYILELLETQSLRATKIYLNKIREKKTASDRRIMNDVRILKMIKAMEEYKEEHPKIERIKNLIKEELEANDKAKIIVFSHFRDNIDALYDVLQDVCKPVILIGQRGDHGLTQKEQINVIRDYECDIYNCMITSPIGEEGLDIKGGADIGIFYDSVPSEIRTIQRRGRVGRTRVGKIFFLLTKDTRDEIYHYSAQRKERNMKTILKGMQNKNTLSNFVK
ncbi:MAG: DEAD/DEAH box helicase [Candidatus Aenigmarchaeota archaeon]|nr:DEAD/DEAH box helicase [Candidatus Aenigmarchaeota archaeon]